MEDGIGTGTGAGQDEDAQHQDGESNSKVSPGQKPEICWRQTFRKATKDSERSTLEKTLKTPDNHKFSVKKRKMADRR